jgi:sorbitol/mannitol transport system permease protein
VTTATKVPLTPEQKAVAKKRARSRRLPLLPALIFLIIVTQIPFLTTVGISLMDWNSLNPDLRKFVGLSNYAHVFQDADLRQSVLTTVQMTVVVVLVSVLLGLGLALLLDHQFFGRGLVRTMLIAPFLVVPVAAALVWKHALLNPAYGLLNGVLTWIWGLFGSTNPPQPEWLSDFPLWAVEASLIWQWTPFMMLIILAGLQSRPLDVFEAASIDGASGWQTFRFITLPHLRRYLELASLLGIIYIIQNFDAVFTLTSGGLGTANLPYSVYQTFYQAHEYGLASAAGVVVVIASQLVAILVLRSVSTLLKEEGR